MKAGDRRTQAATGPEKALGDALRVSMRLLSAACALGLILYMASGVFIVPDGHVGLVWVAGAPVRDAGGAVVCHGPGTYITYPPPLGARVLIAQDVRQVRTDAFWYREDAQDQLAALRRRTRRPRIVPGVDGAVLCGDGTLYHMQVKADYRVRDAAVSWAHFGAAGAAAWDAPREEAVLARLLEHAVVREALSLRILGATVEERGTAGFFTRVRAGLEPVFEARGLELLDVSPAAAPREPLAVREEFLAIQAVRGAAAADVREAAAHRTARAAQARADALEITAGARAAADDIRARAQRDAARAARIASLAVSDATLTRRLLIETFTRVLDAADVHPVYVGAGDRVFEIPVLYDARGAGGSP